MNWNREHEEAMRNPRPGFERGITGLIRSLAELAKAHYDRYGVYIFEDGYLGDEWSQILSSAHAMLNGETGRLDCGTLSRQIEDLRTSGGSPDAVQRVNEVTTPKAVPKKARVELAPIGTKQLTERQRDLLSLIRVEGNLAVYSGTDRIQDWNALKSVMIALGAKWKTGKGFLFPEDVDADQIVATAYHTGQIIDPRQAEFFETPSELAQAMAEFIDPQEGDLVLEPSAGRGALVRAIRAKCPEAELVVCEPLPLHRAELMGLGCKLWGDDFTTAPEGRTFDHVIMNPPFSRRQDVKHITKALGLLRPGGRLAAIASAGVLYRDDTIGKGFRALIESHGGTIEKNPEGCFKAAGTGVSTVTIFLTKA